MSNKKTTLPFILVSDSTVANIFKQNGLVCVYETGTVFAFMNTGKLTFSDDIEKHKIVYSDKLCI